MASSIHIDTRQFNAVLRKAVAASHRTAQEVINTHAYAVAVAAAHACKIADKGKIRHVLGEAHGPVAPTKSGKTPRGKWRQLVYKEDSFAARIIQKRLRDAGKPMLSGQALDERIRKMIIGRAATVGFIASGFVRAARQLRRFAKLRLTETPKGIKVIPGGASGMGIPAGPGGIFGSGKYTAIVGNDVVTGGGRWQAKGMTFHPQSVAGAALSAAMAKEQTEMLNRLKLTLDQALRKVGAI